MLGKINQQHKSQWYDKAAEWSSGRMPTGCAEGGGSNPGWEAQEVSISAETQQSIDIMRHKAVFCLAMDKTPCVEMSHIKQGNITCPFHHFLLILN